MRKLKLKGVNGAHHGLDDWYPENEAVIINALEEGPTSEWTTGWYSSKKGIASAKITSTKGNLQFVVHVVDDFDTAGVDEHTIEHTTNRAAIERAINEAWSKAEANRNDNVCCVGWAIYEGREYIADYIQCANSDYDQPTGDVYENFGFQDDNLPAAVKEKFEAHIQSGNQDELQFGKFKLRKWND